MMQPWLSKMRSANSLIRLRECAGWSESAWCTCPKVRFLTLTLILYNPGNKENQLRIAEKKHIIFLIKTDSNRYINWYNVSRSGRKCTFQICTPCEDSDQPAQSDSLILLGRISDRQGCKVSSCGQRRTYQTAWICRLISVFHHENIPI